MYNSGRNALETKFSFRALKNEARKQGKRPGTEAPTLNKLGLFQKWKLMTKSENTFKSRWGPNVILKVPRGCSVAPMRVNKLTLTFHNIKMG